MLNKRKKYKEIKRENKGGQGRKDKRIGKRGGMDKTKIDYYKNISRKKRGKLLRSSEGNYPTHKYNIFSLVYLFTQMCVG